MSVPSLYDAPPMNNFSRGRSFDDSDPYFGINKQTGKARGLPDTNVLKSIAADNVKASNVAKIKVVVCIFCFSSSCSTPNSSTKNLITFQ